MELNNKNEKKDLSSSKAKYMQLLLKSKILMDNRSKNEDSDSSEEIIDENTNDDKKPKRTKSFDEKFEKELKKNFDLENKLITSIKNAENVNKKDFELANEINFKAIPDKIIETDQFGFIKSKEEKIETKKNEKKKTNKNKYSLLINSRTEK